MRVAFRIAMHVRQDSRLHLIVMTMSKCPLLQGMAEKPVPGFPVVFRTGSHSCIAVAERQGGRGNSRGMQVRYGRSHLRSAQDTTRRAFALCGRKTSGEPCTDVLRMRALRGGAFLHSFFLIIGGRNQGGRGYPVDILRAGSRMATPYRLIRIDEVVGCDPLAVRVTSGNRPDPIF